MGWVGIEPTSRGVRDRCKDQHLLPTRQARARRCAPRPFTWTASASLASLRQDRGPAADVHTRSLRRFTCSGASASKLLAPFGCSRRHRWSWGHRLLSSHPLESNQNLSGFSGARRPTTREWDVCAVRAAGLVEASATVRTARSHIIISSSVVREPPAMRGRTSGVDAATCPSGQARAHLSRFDIEIATPDIESENQIVRRAAARRGTGPRSRDVRNVEGPLGSSPGGPSATTRGHVVSGRYPRGWCYRPDPGFRGKSAQLADHYPPSPDGRRPRTQTSARAGLSSWCGDIASWSSWRWSFRGRCG